MRVVVHAVAGAFAGAQHRTCFGAAPIIFSTTQRSGNTAPARWYGSRFSTSATSSDEHGGVIDIDHLGRHLEVHGVAGIILDDKKHALAAVDRLRGGQHLSRRCDVKHLARQAASSMPRPRNPAWQRLMARSTTEISATLPSPRLAQRDERWDRTLLSGCRVRSAEPAPGSRAACCRRR